MIRSMRRRPFSIALAAPGCWRCPLERHSNNRTNERDLRSAAGREREARGPEAERADLWDRADLAAVPRPIPVDRPRGTGGPAARSPVARGSRPASPRGRRAQTSTMFFRRMFCAFFARTEPAQSIAKPHLFFLPVQAPCCGAAARLARLAPAKRSTRARDAIRVAAASPRLQEFPADSRGRRLADCMRKTSTPLYKSQCTST